MREEPYCPKEIFHIEDLMFHKHRHWPRYHTGVLAMRRIPPKQDSTIDHGFRQHALLNQGLERLLFPNPASLIIH